MLVHRGSCCEGPAEQRRQVRPRAPVSGRSGRPAVLAFCLARVGSKRRARGDEDHEDRRERENLGETPGYCHESSLWSSDKRSGMHVRTWVMDRDGGSVLLALSNVRGDCHLLDGVSPFAISIVSDTVGDSCDYTGGGDRCQWFQRRQKKRKLPTGNLRSLFQGRSGNQPNLRVCRHPPGGCATSGRVGISWPCGSRRGCSRASTDPRIPWWPGRSGRLTGSPSC